MVERPADSIVRSIVLRLFSRDGKPSRPLEQSRRRLVERDPLASREVANLAFNTGAGGPEA
jgi:hypothetical protein